MISDDIEIVDSAFPWEQYRGATVDAWERIKNKIEEPDQQQVDIASSKLRDLVRMCRAVPTISTTAVLREIYHAHPQLSGEAL